MYKAFEHRQFSTHSSCYKAGSNSSEIADTDGEGGEGLEKGRGRGCWTAKDKIRECRPPVCEPVWPSGKALG